MSQLEPLPGQEGGEAERFLTEIGIAWDFFASYETSEPLVVLDFDDGRHGAIGDLPDAPDDLFSCLAAFYELPHSGWLHAKATPFGMKDTPFDLKISYEGIDGPLVVMFSDGTILTAQIEPHKPSQTLTRWEAGVTTGIAQQQIEAIVSLANLAEMPAALATADRQVAEALLAVLGSLARTPQPPKSVVREAARWLGHKLDVFIEEAVKTAGKATGVAGVGGTAYLLQKYAPSLADQIRDLVELAS